MSEHDNGNTNQNEASTATMTTAATINATLVDNLAVLVDIERKLDIIAEILANQSDHPADYLNTEDYPREWSHQPPRPQG